jgi:pimeloyl-ACP methyl ester carboxylesterase
VIDACGHLSFLEQPDAFARVMDSFLRGLTSDKAEGRR